MWDAEAVERYEAWYESPRGAFALAREQRLIADIISVWPRRNNALLEIGCGAGHFLELFYNAGFDVAGIDSSEAMLEKARQRMGNRATLRLGNAERLPFDDGEFDFVALVTALEWMDNQEAVIAEAFRVASRGVVVTYLNAWSCYRMELLFSKWWGSKRRAEDNAAPGSAPQRTRTLLRARWLDALSLCRIIYKVSGRLPNSFRSTLFAPSFLWRGFKPFSLSWAQLLPFGAVGIARVDIVPVTGTPMAVRAPKAARAAQTAVACHSSSCKSDIQ